MGFVVDEVAMGEVFLRVHSFHLWDIAIGIATLYGLEVRGSNPVRSEIFRTCPDRPWGPRSLLYIWYRVFTGGKERPERDADLSHPSSIGVKKE